MFIKLYAIALPVFFAIDMLWLGVVAKGFYFKQIGTLMKTDINWTAAIVFYCIFIGGLTFFAILPAVENNSWIHALLLGALFGFISYATYDLTNLATLKSWPLVVSLVDMAWGRILGASVAFITFWAASLIGIR